MKLGHFCLVMQNKVAAMAEPVYFSANFVSNSGVYFSATFACNCGELCCWLSALSSC